MDIIQKKRKALRETHKEEFHVLEKYSGHIRMAQFLVNKAKEFFDGCRVSWNEGTKYHSISINLTKDYNVSEHVNIFIDEYQYILKHFLYSWKQEPDIVHDDNSRSMDYKYGNLSIYVYYGSGRCERVKVGTTQKTVTKDVYELRCY